MYPDDNQIINIIDGAFGTLVTDFKKPLKRQGSGNEAFIIWHEEMEVTPQHPLVLTKVAKRKVGMPMTMHALATACKVAP